MFSMPPLPPRDNSRVMVGRGMEQPFDILVIGGDDASIDVIKKGCAQRGHVAKIARTGKEGLQVHRDEGAELVIVQLPVADVPGATLLRQLPARIRASPSSPPAKIRRCRARRTRCSSAPSNTCPSRR